MCNIRGGCDYVQGCPLIPAKVVGDEIKKTAQIVQNLEKYEVQTTHKEPDLNLAGKSPPSPFIRAYVIPRWDPKVRWRNNRALFTPRLCHWDIMGPAWPKAFFWFPSNGEENGSQRKVSVSVRCSLVRLRNAKNNTAGLVLRTRRGNYKLKTLDLRTFPGI